MTAIDRLCLGSIFSSRAWNSLFFSTGTFFDLPCLMASTT